MARIKATNRLPLPALDKIRLGQLIDMFGSIKVGNEASRAKDVPGRLYQYVLSQFARAEGKKGGKRLREHKRWQNGVPAGKVCTMGEATRGPRP